MTRTLTHSIGKIVRFSIIFVFLDLCFVGVAVYVCRSMLEHAFHSKRFAVRTARALALSVDHVMRPCPLRTMSNEQRRTRGHDAHSSLGTTLVCNVCDPRYNFGVDEPKFATIGDAFQATFKYAILGPEWDEVDTKRSWAVSFAWFYAFAVLQMLIM